MLRRVPDDPGGLLRQKFRYQSQQRWCRFRLSFEPHSMRARVENGEGVVVVRGRNGEEAEVPVIQEPDGWRVRLVGLTEPPTNAEAEPDAPLADQPSESQ